MNERHQQESAEPLESNGQHGPSSPAGDSSPYGPAACKVLHTIQETLRQAIPAAIDLFYVRLSRLELPKQLLGTLSDDEHAHLRAAQKANLQLIANPELTEEAHRASAMKIGRVHAIVGLDRQYLARSRGVLLGSLADCIDVSAYGECLSILSRRLNRDLAWQLEAYESLQEARQQAVLAITELAWSAGSYSDLIAQVVRILASLDEVTACAIGRPDHQGVLRFEAVSDARMQGYLEAMEESDCSISIHADDPTGQGPAGNAWRSGKPERVVNFQTDRRVAAWSEMARNAGFRSSVAIPIRAPGHLPLAVLSLYSALPGGYSGTSQRVFVDLLQTLLGFALAHIQATEGEANTIPFGVRQRWVTLLRSDALQMHYQPIVDLASGEVKKVEVLARLYDGEQLLAPGDFLSVLSTEDFFALYVRALKRALEQRNVWLEAGFDLGMSINLPSMALHDSRYVEATQEAMTALGCPAGRLILEVLETERVPQSLECHDEFGKFKAIGVLLAEDDLGSGHSSLARLHEFPFDLVKIDRSIVGEIKRDASDPLRFVYQLTRLGHSLRMSVVAEGIEDPALLPALRVLGVDAAQGYAIARPLPANEFFAWLRERTGEPPHGNETNRFVQLAQFMLWEEKLSLVIDDAYSRERLRDGLFATPLQRRLVQVALEYGMRSPQYRALRDQMQTGAPA
ncbi:EAL domain-containing protein [Trinickia diaoshuihuensis]|uniref:EAL domain-containing protein n=1 Tax=Trinickia diaoshuihuensis TaxID=2292265 RepID=UPI0013C2CD20|nr:EAL domain-containing protein [Trinickia diaoshuihuensis]